MSRLHQASASGNLDKVRQYLLSGDHVNEMTQSVTSAGIAYDALSPDKRAGEFGRRMTPLHLAAYHGYMLVAELLSQTPGIDLNIRDQWRDVVGNTALEIAVQKKNIGLAQMLFRAGATDEKGVLAQALCKRDINEELFQAALCKKPEVVSDLLSQGLINKANGEKTLYYAAKYDSVAVAHVLIDGGISPSDYIETNPCLGERCTILGIAVENNSEKVIELLLSRNIDVDQITGFSNRKSGATPLSEAIIHTGGRKPNPKIVSLLLNAGADIKKIDTFSFKLFIEYGDADELALLIDAGLSPNLTIDGKSFLEICLSKTKLIMAAKLVEHGADVSFVATGGGTYLHRSHHVELTRALINRGLDVNAKDQLGKTPIQRSTDKKSVELMAQCGADISRLSMHNSHMQSSLFLAQKLIENGSADFNEVNADGKTPLYIMTSKAFFDGYLDVLTYALQNVTGIFVNARCGNMGWTALHEAFSLNYGVFRCRTESDEDQAIAKNKYTRVIDLLIAYSAKPIRDKEGRTPLMCLDKERMHRDSLGYNKRLIEKYYEYEALYHGFPPEFYKQELIRMHNTGFKDADIAQLWKTRAKTVRNTCLLGQGKRQRSSTLFQLPYELIRHIGGYMESQNLTEVLADKSAEHGLYYHKR